MLRGIILIFCISITGQLVFCLSEDNAKELRHQINKNMVMELERKYEDHIEPVIKTIDSFQDGYDQKSRALFASGMIISVLGAIGIGVDVADSKALSGSAIFLGLIATSASYLKCFKWDKTKAFCKWKKLHKQEFRDAQDAIAATDTYKHMYELDQTEDGQELLSNVQQFKENWEKLCKACKEKKA